MTYSYDGNHHVTQRTDALGQQTQYSYDAYERLVEVRHYVGGTEQTRQRVDYVYDTPIPGGYTQNYTWGRLSAVVFQGQTPFGFDLDFAYEYSYNQAGRVTGNRMLANGGGMQVFDLQAQYGWDNQGRMNSMTYPSGPVMTYTFDAMGRPTGMSETACILPGGQTCTAQSWGAYATYGSAGQILTLGGGGHLGMGVYQGTPYDIYGESSETRTYNSMLQLTHLTGSAQSTGPTGPPSSVGGSMDIQYVYNTGHNNGRVTQTIDGILGETVNYQYDYLHRLTGATATNNAWGEAYSYDGFGNLTAKTPTVGSAPTFAGSASSNAQNGSLPGQWDVENRPMTQGSTFYAYDPWGRRIWKQWTGQTGANECEAYFYGATGQKLESYSCEYTPNTIDWFTTLEGSNTYFGGKMLSEKGVAVLTDRLGSVRANSNGESFSYFPWGEERGTGTADGRTKFAGYYRDAPGQDYANYRYYSATTGSFWSPDPAGAGAADTGYGSGMAASYIPGFGAAHPDTPLSWNRYLYSLGDPINLFDPIGKYACDPDVDDSCEDEPDCGDALSPCPADPDEGGGDEGGRSTQKRGR